MCLLRSPDFISYVVVAAIFLCPNFQQNKGVVNVELALSLGEKSKTLKGGQNPEKILRLWNGALECNKVHAQRGRREKEWERRETETVFYGRRSKRVVVVGRGQALMSCNLISGKTTKTKP
jgi:hypothetical protein